MPFFHSVVNLSLVNRRDMKFEVLRFLSTLSLLPCEEHVT